MEVGWDCPIEQECPKFVQCICRFLGDGKPATVTANLQLHVQVLFAVALYGVVTNNSGAISRV